MAHHLPVGFFCTLKLHSPVFLVKFSTGCSSIIIPYNCAGKETYYNGEDCIPQDQLDDVKHRLRTELESVEKKLKALDASMIGALDRARTKSIEELDRLQNKVRNARQNREGTGIKQLRRLCNSLRPRARMQERVFGPVTFLNAHGAKLADELIGAADPFRIEHGVLEL